ncbi:MAG TPA: Maf family protein [Thermoleophilaceae bacterium]|nr:Maf family protein [Thermoleophilaceae bacterium]
MTAAPLVLASRSPQRRAILEQLGVEFRVVASGVEELSRGAPDLLVVENARRKAEAVEGTLVLGVDTTVVLDGRTYGKPLDGDAAGEVLYALSGREHEVWSGLALRRGGEVAVRSARTLVRFRTLSAVEIEWYLATGEWRERAGGYAIQGRGAALVEEIEGDFWNVVGLPVAALVGLAPELVMAGRGSR